VLEEQPVVGVRVDDQLGVGMCPAGRYELTVRTRMSSALLEYLLERASRAEARPGPRASQRASPAYRLSLDRQEARAVGAAPGARSSQSASTPSSAAMAVLSTSALT
jgi:hypothetical protein